ncbi:MarR family transcriptional regulator [Pararhizobium sp. YC-54]|uniref:MarR family winged helix-turn-helix transcriptional regulator n=1 Tax=Pararhizobium sp. YC-54 TaxID=2986920 RepID=UPI0021F75D5B|nr:MarR family transcriptional regulator [Pararhizobium sp. YC-54]MCV9999437.1 MarR family transcriptional regulator [Pararhizobium sp. YC-54]
MNNIHNYNNASFPPDETALARLFLVTVILSDDMKQGLEERGLTRARASALWAISHREAITQRELADVLKVTPRNVTTLIDGLEKTGFVKRRDHPNDRRAILLDLTPAGIEITDRLKRETRAFAQKLFEGMSPAKLQEFIATLDFVVSRLETLIAPLSTPD